MQRTRQHEVHQVAAPRCLEDPDGDCYTPKEGGRWSNRKFRSSKRNIGRQDVTWGRFTNPKEARAKIVKAVRKKLNREANARFRVKGQSDPRTAKGLVRQIFKNTDSQYDCAAPYNRAYTPYGWQYNDVCEKGEGSVNDETFQKVGGVVLCAAGVVVTYATAGSGAVVVYQTGVCTWAAYDLFSD